MRHAAAAIRHAASDPRVVGLVATGFGEGDSALSLADSQELRDAVAHFRKVESGHQVVIL